MLPIVPPSPSSPLPSQPGSRCSEQGWIRSPTMEQGFPSCPPSSSPCPPAPPELLPLPPSSLHPGSHQQERGVQVPRWLCRPPGTQPGLAEPLQHTGCSAVGKHNAGQALLYR